MYHHILQLKLNSYPPWKAAEVMESMIYADNRRRRGAPTYSWWCEDEDVNLWYRELQRVLVQARNCRNVACVAHVWPASRAQWRALYALRSFAASKKSWKWRRCLQKQNAGGGNPAGESLSNLRDPQNAGTHFIFTTVDFTSYPESFFNFFHPCLAGSSGAIRGSWGEWRTWAYIQRWFATTHRCHDTAMLDVSQTWLCMVVSRCISKLNRSLVKWVEGKGCNQTDIIKTSGSFWNDQCMTVSPLGVLVTTT